MLFVCICVCVMCLGNIQSQPTDQPTDRPTERMRIKQTETDKQTVGMALEWRGVGGDEEEDTPTTAKSAQ